MAQTKLKTDYLIAGSGAMGMAFADTLLSDSDSDMIIIDRFHKPGGHWNNAYPFVTLHQPSAFYGVSSRELSNGRLDDHGLNKGLGHLATGAEVLAYFDNVMRERFLPSGRVRYYPMCDWQGDNCFKSVLTGDVFEVSVDRKIVDATWLKTSVPSTHTPNFTIDKKVRFLTPNTLPKVDERPDGFTVIGGGKTGIDTCLWLMENGVDPGDIRWIMPRDGWLLNRINTQPTIEFFDNTIGAQVAQFEAIAAANNVDDLFNRLEKADILLRIDKTVKPKMFHGATVSKAELTELRKIENIIRMGRVTHLGETGIKFQNGTLKTTLDTVHIDCSARAISNLETKPVFEKGLITGQTVRSYQPVFSASMIAHIEATRESDKEKNALCGVVPLPNDDTDWIRMMIPFMMNQYQWSRDSEIRAWLANNRLDGFSSMIRSINENDTEKMTTLKRLRDATMPAIAKLHQFKAELDSQ